MSTISDRRGLVGYTLDDVLANNKRPPPAVASPARAGDIRNRTLLDIIRDEEPGATKLLFGHKDKRTWKSFRDKLRLRRAGSAWVSTVPIPTSDILIHNKRYLIGKRNQLRFDTVSPKHNQIEASPKQSSASDPSAASRPIPTENESPQHGVRTMRPSMSRHYSVRISEDIDDFADPTEPERDHRVHQTSATLSEDRTMSAREAVAAQEAADAAAAAEAAEEEEEESESGDENEESESESESAASQPVRMSLMDLLQETDKEMGLDGLSYAMGEEEEDEELYEEEEEEEEEGEETCCVCMVRHRGAALNHCGHTFCKLCSRELMVGRGNCPTCNGFILEIIHVF